ncbi:hypothetical protein RSAG8_12525, partial [Rhizoctonia solani AG-8 WAC10335]
MYWNQEYEAMSSCGSVLAAVLHPILTLLGGATNSFIFAAAMTPGPKGFVIKENSCSLSNWDISALLEQPEGLELISILQRWYTVHEGQDLGQNSRRPDLCDPPSLYTPEYKALINAASQSMLPELSGYLTLTEQYEALDLAKQTVPKGIFDEKFPRTEKWPSYIPTLLPSFADLTVWVSSPMPDAFVASYSAEAHIDSPENLLIWFSSQPFVDPSNGLPLGGSGGVSFAVHILLRVLITGRYLLHCPSVFGSPVDSIIAIRRIRPIVPPWHTFFEEAFRKNGKPLPEPMRLVIAKDERISPDASQEYAIEDIATKTSKLGIKKISPSPRNIQCLPDENHASNAATTSEEKEKAYIYVSD